MIIYISLFVVAMYKGFFSIYTRYTIRPISLLFFLLVFLVVALRYASVDYFNYLSIYERIIDFNQLGLFIYPINEQTPIESGFALLVLLEKEWINNFYFFIFLFSAISLGVKYYAFNKLSPYVLITILLYLSDEYFWKDLGQMRNAMASGILLLSVFFAYERNVGKFLITVLIAGLFHSFAFVGVVIYWMRLIASPAQMWLAISTSTIVAVLGGIGLLLPVVAIRLGVAETSRIIAYVDTKYAEGFSVFGGTFITQLCVSALLVFFYKRLVEKWAYNSVLIPMYVYGTALMFMFIDYGIIAGRVREMLCVPALVVTLPSFLLLFRPEQRFVPYMGILLYCGVWFYAMVRDMDAYQSIL